MEKPTRFALSRAGQELQDIGQELLGISQYRNELEVVPELEIEVSHLRRLVDNLGALLATISPAHAAR